MLRALVFAAVFAIPGTALADRSDADACAAKLSGQTKVIYRSVVASVQKGSTLEQAVTKAAKPKVDSGRLTENEARRMGRDAANCARLIHRKA
jgi:hypothetical protein